jgi:aspartyl-tRNA(Asn)/glutamyl-tRNA(Gln) amidotransferase subunit A
MEEPLTIHEAAAAMRGGALTPIDLLEQCLARIDRYESLVRAWVVIDRDGARQQAEWLTDELMRGQVRGPLHGIPIGVKDIIDVFDLPTGCGSRLWANSIARQDATCIKRLRAAGGLILGKTVTTAFAYLDPPVTRNPWDPTRTPGGSSSGSAAAVACGMCLAALGTQTGGSLTRPASYCGVASCKPSWGRIAGDGVLPLAPSLDHVGVMARSVRDLEILLRPFGEFDALESAPPAAITLGRLRGPFEVDADSESWRRLAEFAGREIVVTDVALPARFADLWPSHRALMAVEAAGVHGDRYRRRPDDYPPIITELVEEGLRLGEAAGSRELTRRETLRAELSPLLDRFDSLVTPATTGPAPGRETTGNPRFNSPWSYLGWPTVSFPVGVVADGGWPISAQLIGRPNGEGALLAVAAACEKKVGWKSDLPPLPS